jgi:hypothetical protein
MADGIYRCAIDTLYIRNRRRFMYQRGRYFSNRTDYLRWTQAWAFYSIALFANRTSGVQRSGAKEIVQCNA